MKRISTVMTFFALVSIFKVDLVFSAELNDVKMAEKVKVGDKELQLNGMGTRIVHKFGIPVKVYVGGLYLEKKTQDPKALIESEGVRRIAMEFKRSVTSDQARDSWKEGFDNNCFVECPESKKKFNQEFNPAMKGLNKGEIMAVNFFKDKVELEIPGQPTKTVQGAAFSKNLMAVYFGKSPVNVELYKGLLGIKQ